MSDTSAEVLPQSGDILINRWRHDCRPSNIPNEESCTYLLLRLKIPLSDFWCTLRGDGRREDQGWWSPGDSNLTKELWRRGCLIATWSPHHRQPLVM